MVAEVSIFFGSQSGTAECFSEELRDEAADKGISAEVIDLKDFTPEGLAARKIAVFIVSTYGDGEPTDNAIAFHNWASNARHDGALIGQRFAVMGLGDMNYEKYNNMGRMTDANLERLGSKRIYGRGVGDDGQDIADDFQKWRTGGFWEALTKAIAQVRAEGGFDVSNAAIGTAVTQVEVAAPKRQVFAFHIKDDDEGAAQDVCELFAEKFKATDNCDLIVKNLSHSKCHEDIRNLPKHGVCLMIVDASPAALCAPAKKLVRKMNIDLNSKSLEEKELCIVTIAVASTKCNLSGSNTTLDKFKTVLEPLDSAFRRVGAGILKDTVTTLPTCLDAGVDDMGPALSEAFTAIKDAIQSAAPKPASRQAAPPVAATPAASPQTAQTATTPAKPAAPSAKTIILCSGSEAREAGDALVAAWGDNCSAEEANLMLLTSSPKTQVVLAIECDEATKGLCQAARGLVTQLNAAPMPKKMQLKQLRFLLLAVVATDYGNAGERACANESRNAIALAAAQVAQVLTKCGATQVATVNLDLQDTNEKGLSDVCDEMKRHFAGGAAGAAPAPAPAQVAAGNATTVAAAPVAPMSATVGPAVLKMAASIAELPKECPGEPADVLSRFFFEAHKSKVLKVRELRQKPNAEEGLSTVEVEIEATEGLKGYSVGGTLQLMPESDPRDVEAILSVLGLTRSDLTKAVTFVAESEGGKIKRPFPTPCTIGEALSRYCDLARAPTKKMLTALQPKLKDESARQRVEKLLADGEVLKQLQAESTCCRMHEFWALVGVGAGGINLGDFLLNCPRQKAREFTIASSPVAVPDKIRLCVSLTSHEVPELGALAETLRGIGAAADFTPASREGGRARFFGTCSRWLTTRLQVGHAVLAKQRPSPLRLPEKDVPIVMVGAGAGLAPFRGFWEELSKGKQTAPAALFFGCRHPEQDWLFKEEMSAAVKLNQNAALARLQVGPKKPLAHLYTAFSRPDEGRTKQYVQDLLIKEKMAVKHWVEKSGGSVFICGSSAMGHAVLDALAEALEGGKPTVEALRKEGRIVAEMWG